MLKNLLVAAAGIFRLAGVPAERSVSLRLTTRPSGGAGAEMFTLPVTPLQPTTVGWHRGGWHQVLFSLAAGRPKCIPHRHHRRIGVTHTQQQLRLRLRIARVRQKCLEEIAAARQPSNLNATVTETLLGIVQIEPASSVHVAFYRLQSDSKSAPVRIDGAVTSDTQRLDPRSHVRGRLIAQTVGELVSRLFRIHPRLNDIQSLRHRTMVLFLLEECDLVTRKPRSRWENEWPAAR